MGAPALHLFATATFPGSVAGGTGAQGPESKPEAGNAERSSAVSGVSFPAALAVGARTRPTAISTATKTPRLVTRLRPNGVGCARSAVVCPTLLIASAPRNIVALSHLCARCVLMFLDRGTLKRYSTSEDLLTM